jgi:hypothetical protein
MSAAYQTPGSEPNGFSGGSVGERIAFLLTIAYAGAMLWFARHLPLVDFPQHAAQVVALRDLLNGTSHWQGLLTVNYLVPYLIGYGLALPLSLLFPVSAALTLVLMLAFFCYVLTCVALRRDFGGDARLDWLFVPGFFGFAYVWGFYTFLVASPVALLFILLANRCANAPRPLRVAGLATLGLLLFFCHGLMFLFAHAVGLGLVLVRMARIRRVGIELLPYLTSGCAVLLYAWMTRNTEAGFASMEVDWRWNWHRLGFLLDAWGASSCDLILVPAAALLFLVPWILGMRLNRANQGARVPMAVLMIVWMAAPHAALKTYFLFERFALFLLPAFALALRRAEFPRTVRMPGSARNPLARFALPALVWVFLAYQTNRIVAFGRECADIDALMASIEPGQRALALVIDPASSAARSPWAYLHYASWYQAEHGGLVDFNFASFPPEVVHYRPQHEPAIRPGFEWNPQGFLWSRDEGSVYRYFFVRDFRPLDNNLLKSDQCRVELIARRGPWSIFENRGCR